MGGEPTSQGYFVQMRWPHAEVQRGGDGPSARIWGTGVGSPPAQPTEASIESPLSDIRVSTKHNLQHICRYGHTSNTSRYSLVASLQQTKKLSLTMPRCNLQTEKMRPLHSLTV